MVGALFPLTTEQEFPLPLESILQLDGLFDGLASATAASAITTTVKIIAANPRPLIPDASDG
jgi:hypothetical protein